MWKIDNSGTITKKALPLDATNSISDNDGTHKMNPTPMTPEDGLVWEETVFYKREGL